MKGNCFTSQKENRNVKSEILITHRLFDVHLQEGIERDKKVVREKGSQLLEQDRVQSFENEKEKHPSSTLSLS